MAEEIEVSDDEYNAIMDDALSRYRQYARRMNGRAANQTINERDSFEYLLLTSAYAAGHKAIAKR